AYLPVCDAVCVATVDCAPLGVTVVWTCWSFAPPQANAGAAKAASATASTEAFTSRIGNFLSLAKSSADQSRAMQGPVKAAARTLGSRLREGARPRAPQPASLSS